MALRLGSLLGRFILTIYIARYLGTSALSLYGYVIGAIAVMIALGGLGLNYQTDRETVGGSLFMVSLMVRDRLLVRLLVSLPTTLVACALMTIIFGGWMAVLPPAIVLGEALIADVQRTLVLRHFPLLANVLLIVRSAAWVPPVAALGILDPEWRTLQVVFGGWALGLLASYVVVGSLLWRVPSVRRGRALPVDWPWIARSMRGNRRVWLADCGAVAVGYSDRFLIGAVLGLDAAGVFIFLWSFTNAIVTLVQQGAFQQFMPRLMLLWRHGEHAAWRRALRSGVRGIAFSAVVMGAWAVAALLLVFPRFGLSAGRDHDALLLLMVAGTVVRLLAEALHDALYSARADAACISIWILGLAIAPPVTLACLLLFGLPGAGVQIIVSGALLLALRYRFLRPLLDGST